MGHDTGEGQAVTVKARAPSGDGPNQDCHCQASPGLQVGRVKGESDEGVMAQHPA